MMDGGGGWWMWGGSLLLIALFVAVIVMVVHQMGSAGNRAPEPPRAEPSRRSADEVLAERFARGEIDESEYRQRRDALRS